MLSKCDRILYLDEGKIIGMDSHDNLANACHPYREYLSAVKTTGD